MYLSAFTNRVKRKLNNMNTLYIKEKTKSLDNYGIHYSKPYRLKWFGDNILCFNATFFSLE